MALQNINIGTTANDGTGDDARTWAAKSNANFQYLDNLIGSLASEVENSPYFDMAAMYADQGNQTEGKIQYVLDAIAHPDVTTNEARHFSYLGTTVGDDTDYRLLSYSEAAALTNPAAHRTFMVEYVQDDASPLTSITAYKIGFEYSISTNKMTAIVFNAAFTDAIQKFVDEVGSVDYYIKIYNRSNNLFTFAKITGFTTVNTDYTRAAITGLIPRTGVISVNHKIEVSIDIDVEGAGGTGMDAATYDPANKAEQVLTIGDKAVANGVASLGGDGKVPAAQLPSYVDDVIEGYYDSGTFYEEVGLVTPITPTTGKIYIDLSTEDTYRYSGSVYVKISDVLSAADVKTLYESNADTNAFTDALLAKLDGIEAGADVTDATNVDAAGAVMNTDTTTAAMAFVIDDDTMATASATKLSTSESVKAYADTKAAKSQTDFISGLIPAPADQDYKLIVKAPYAGTITETTTISTTGTCTATFKINTTALGGTANSVSITEQSQAHASANAFIAGDDIVLTVSSNVSCENMSFTIKFTKTLS